MKLIILQKNLYNKRKKAFTLAEVLLTLAVIGIVAALTVPQLLANTENAHMVAKLRKAQSALQQAVKMSMAQSSISDLQVSGYFSGNMQPLTAWTTFKPYLNLIKDCGTGSGCFPAGVMYKYLNGTNHDVFNTASYIAKGVMADGTLIYLYDQNGDCNTDFSLNHSGPLSTLCGSFGIDLNGDSAPNIDGLDIFTFTIAKNGTIYPSGALDEIYNQCSRTGSLAAGDGYAGTGFACTHKALDQGKIDW